MKKWFLMGFVVIFSIVSSSVVVYGAEAEPQTFITKFDNTDSSLTGVSATTNLYFQILDYWEVDQVRLNLDYQISQLTKNDVSSVTLSINGMKFNSFRPTETSLEKQHLVIDIPKELIKQGSNVLKIEGAIMTTNGEDQCSLTETPADWLHIFKGSNVGVNYTKKEMPETIQAFYERFSGMDSVVHKEVAVIVPEKATPTELETATYTLSGSAKANGQDEQQIPIGTLNYSHLAQLPLVVLVAEYDHLPADYQTKIDKNSVKEQAVLKVIKKENQTVLVITSSDKKALVKAGRYSANEELMSETQLVSKEVSKDLDTATSHLKIEEDFQMTSTGDELKGPFHQEQTYFMSLPANRSLAANSQVNLAFRYAKNLDFDRSLMTVSIGGIPIGSKKLTKEYADGDTATFTLPPDLDVSGNFAVTVSFDLEIKDLQCTPRQDETPWAYISPESMMRVNTKDRTDLLFENYPFPFLKDGSFNQIAVVLPEDMNADYYRGLTNIFNLLGKYAQDNTGEVVFYSSSATKEELKSSNIITMGSALDNTFIKGINEKLYFKYDKDGAGFLSNEKLSIESNYGQQIGTGQLLHSPYTASNGLLVMTGATPQSVYLASKELSTQDKVQKHSGDAFTVDKDNRVNSYRFKKKGDIGEATTFVDKVKKESNLLLYLGLVGLVLASILIALILAFRKNRLDKEDNDEK
ncbi:cellulose biosynthesis cyclic di-GMP-binding regulatory protein BcsB [Carnobacterium maltaromaticum]|uniref:cellulose biosynthesis cyclic di-GMP-binding regulatory protein BcsB n=1 Tax=Carnobacterium maltaromaticum TaxID=2751 RepID=UPI00107292CE|nr:cellulose biosynthesis cyclic di-GMP-binding regulatory protein BcsB [Carnobacterium maltaromaticum]TFJ72344.1 cellulose synthase [Carnobacterium maltaromaticum]TFJ77257.1 cellulose synthase [Carnobacterium maltaromaticum]